MRPLPPPHSTQHLSLGFGRGGKNFTQHNLLNRAADFFTQIRKPPVEWKELDDVSAQLSEFELRCEAGDYDSAASILIMTDIDFDYLFVWGHYHLLIGLYQQVVEKIQEPKLRIGIILNLGSAYNSIGEVGIAMKQYEKALDLSRENKSRRQEGAALSNLGSTYYSLGKTHKAIEFYEEAVIIGRELGNHGGESGNLSNLGNTYYSLGDIGKAIEFYGQALIIHREIGDRRGEGNDLQGLGICYADLNDARKAVEFYRQALFIYREIGDVSGESVDLENTGHAFLSIEEYQKAKENYQQAIQISDEVLFLQTQQLARWGLAKAYLFQNNLIDARTTIEAALQFDVPQYNHNATALHGIIALRQTDTNIAGEAFAKSIAQASEILAMTPDYYEALDAKGLALCGRAVSGEWNMEDGGRMRDEVIAEAVETFRKARKIAPHAGVVKRVLRLFDELVKCDEDGILKDVREVVEGSG